ncbi:MAG: TolC family protein, partial [Phycisphaerales bacterium]
LASEVRRTYFDHVASVQELDLMRNVEESTAASTDLSERLRAAGNVRALDVSGEQALHEESIVGSNRAAAKVIRTREHMNALMGLAGAQTAWTAPSRLPVVPDAVEGAQDAEARAIASSLDLEIERRRVEIAAKSLGITQPFPWLHEGEVGIAAGKDLDTGWAMGPSLSIPIPIFDNGEADTQAAKAELRRAYDRQAALASEIRAAARAAVGELGAAHARVARYQEKILPLRQRIVDESQLQYNAMQISAFQLLQAKRDQISAGSDYVGSIREYWIARCELERILQGRVSGFKGMELGENNARGAMSAAERGQ